MLRSEGSDSKLKLWTKRTAIPVFCLFALLLGASSAFAQGTSEFTLTTSAMSPDAVAPGGVASTTITVDPVGGYSGSVALSCQITPVSNIPITDTPVCTVSPASVTPSASATANITTQVATTTIAYNVVITAHGATTSYTAPELQLTVLAVTPQFTLTVQSPLTPTSVVAGNGAEGVVTINPINGYTSPSGGITLYCGTISPLVTIAPVCSFNPNGPNLTVDGTPVQSTITVSTFGNVTTGSVSRPRSFYALWWSLPLLGLAAFGAAGSRRSRKACGLLAIFILSATILLLPACSNTTNTVTAPNGFTPSNTYTFTLIGVDAAGVVSSNTGSGSSATTVSLTVTNPK